MASYLVAFSTECDCLASWWVYHGRPVPLIFPMDPERPIVETEKDCDPNGQKIVCKHRVMSVTQGPDADRYALCTLGPHWVEKSLVRLGACRDCLSVTVDFMETETHKRKYNE